MAEQSTVGACPGHGDADGNRITLRKSGPAWVEQRFTGLANRGKTIFVDKTAGPTRTAWRSPSTTFRDGVTNAFDAAHPGDIVRIVGNGGRDGQSVHAGGQFRLRDRLRHAARPDPQRRRRMAVPQGVTVMIEPAPSSSCGSACIGVGSSSLTVDRSGGALQVLGTPQRNVYFTSWMDETIGLRHAPRPPRCRPRATGAGSCSAPTWTTPNRGSTSSTKASS